VGGAVLAEVLRGGLVESTHTGTYVLLDRDGRVERTAGTPDELLVLVAASYTGEQRHVDLVEQLLATLTLDVTTLRNRPAVPLDPVRAAVPGPSAVGAPCSGEHASMIATCVHSGWPSAGYEVPDHPLQRWLLRAIERLTGARAGVTVFDGCGAPTFSVPLTALARAMRRRVLAEPGSPERRVADAMRAHPEVVGGEVRAVTRAIRAVPGLLAKDGVERVVAFALVDGRARGEGARRRRPRARSGAAGRAGCLVGGLRRAPLRAADTARGPVRGPSAHGSAQPIHRERLTIGGPCTKGRPQF
jgi:L-asparaginase II